MTAMTYQTVERDSFFTRLDFRPKLVMMVVISIIAFVWESPLAQALLAAAVIVSCLLVGVKWAYIRMIFKLMIPFYILLLITHGFFNVAQIQALTGQAELTPLFTFPESWPLIGGGMMSVEGVLYGLNVIFKTLTLVLVIPLGIFTTEVDKFIVGMVKARVPYKLAFIFSATLRFVPLLFGEIQAIIEAQRLRGLAVEKMGLLQARAGLCQGRRASHPGRHGQVSDARSRAPIQGVHRHRGPYLSPRVKSAPARLPHDRVLRGVLHPGHRRVSHRRIRQVRDLHLAMTILRGTQSSVEFGPGRPTLLDQRPDSCLRPG